jgi:hypothetical protein
MRKNLQEIRRSYAPRSPAETELLQAYRDSIQDFGREMLKPRGKINARRLNLLSEAAVDAFITYRMIQELR